MASAPQNRPAVITLAALRRGLSDAAIGVLAYSLARGSFWPTCDPANSQLQALLGVSHFTISRAQKELEDAGLVVYKRPKRRHPRAYARMKREGVADAQTNRIVAVAVEATPGPGRPFVFLSVEAVASIGPDASKLACALRRLALQRSEAFVTDATNIYTLGKNLL
jgi:hypothetical protein